MLMRRDRSKEGSPSPRGRRPRRRRTVAAALVLPAATLGVVSTIHGASAEVASTAAPCPIGTPTSRSVEHTFQRASMDPGPFNSVGYMTYVKGLAVDDLFNIPPGDQSAPTNETDARFSHRETGKLIHTIPNSFVPPRAGENNAFETTIDTAKHDIYYDPSPNRSWLTPSTFTTGQLVATYDLTETDFVDLKSQVGTGTAQIKLSYSKDFNLASGRRFNFSSLGTSLVASYQFQVNTGLVSPEPDFPLVVVDSGVYQCS
jgi:hypothetical protein